MCFKVRKRLTVVVENMYTENEFLGFFSLKVHKKCMEERKEFSER